MATTTTDKDSHGMYVYPLPSNADVLEALRRLLQYYETRIYGEVLTVAEQDVINTARRVVGRFNKLEN